MPSGSFELKQIALAGLVFAQYSAAVRLLDDEETLTFVAPPISARFSPTWTSGRLLSASG